MKLNSLEAGVLGKLLEGDDPVLVTLREQLPELEVKARELTGVGFFTYFREPSRDSSLQALELLLADVGADIDGMSNGAGFVLTVRSGVSGCSRVSRSRSHGLRVAKTSGSTI